MFNLSETNKDVDTNEKNKPVKNSRIISENINLSSANDIFSIGVDSIFVDNPLDLLGKF